MKAKLQTIPHLPGSYQMLNSNNVIIYVGKAKDLNKRINSYFNHLQTGKTLKLVSEIKDFTYIVTKDEQEAFILENNLIKENKPKYNFLLKDDKTYPYIEYIGKPYPKLKVVRYLKIKKQNHKFLFGPYPNVYAARKIVTLINRLYPLKKCSNMPKKVCLYYHLGECLGYCEKNIDSFKLSQMEKEILSFLNGNDKILKDKILAKINFFSKNLNYEAALELKKELDYIAIILDKQRIDFHDHLNRDVIGYYLAEGLVAIQILFIRHGKIVGGTNDKFYLISDLVDEITSYLISFYKKHEVPKEIIINQELDQQILANIIPTCFISPIKGKKKSLLAMANLNAQTSLEHELAIIRNNEKRTILANEELQKILNLKVLDRIDVFDNSNLFGSFAVSGMVVFKNGIKSKKDYRKYKITIEKNDDYNMMKEVIYRRYYRALVEKSEMPDLILVDGGKNQIRAAQDVLNDLNLNILVCGLKKDHHHQTSVLVNNLLVEIPIPRTSDLFHYLTRIQDEVHRYTISFHKSLRNKSGLASILDNVSGIGQVRRNKLIKKYQNLQNIKKASITELSQIIPKNIALNLKKYLTLKEVDS